MNKNNLLLAGVAIALLLFLTDIGLRIWYFKDMHLQFDSQIFNNVVTPIMTIIATVIYAWALTTTINQNKISISQNIKPFYEKEIEKVINKRKNTNIDPGGLFPNEEINGLNYFNYISRCVYDLSRNKQYEIDYNDYKNGKKFNKEYFYDCIYSKEVDFINKYGFWGIDMFLLFNEINILIDKIMSSNLIEDDKKILKQTIYNELLSGYFILINLDLNKKIIPEVPYIYGSNDTSDIEFKKISENITNSSFDKLKKHLKGIM